MMSSDSSTWSPISSNRSLISRLRLTLKNSEVPRTMTRRLRTTIAVTMSDDLFQRRVVCPADGVVAVQLDDFLLQLEGPLLGRRAALAELLRPLLEVFLRRVGPAGALDEDLVVDPRRVNVAQLVIDADELAVLQEVEVARPARRDDGQARRGGLEDGQAVALAPGQRDQRLDLRV